VAIAKAVAVLDAKLVLGGQDPAGVRHLLGDSDAELVILALEWISDHRRREFGADILPLLGNSDDRIARAAVETLGVVGSQEHVQELLASARLADPVQARGLYNALAQLGGPDAVAFLTFAARNEDDPGLAQAARHALARAQLVTDDPVRARQEVLRGHR
jgi:hypothetical protein